jgi:DnaJ-class molecular chaperone
LDSLYLWKNKVAHKENYANECHYDNLTYDIEELCPICGGSGNASVKRKQFIPKKCKHCNGTGIIEKINIQEETL